jgi:hypothetical protein
MSIAGATPASDAGKPAPQNGGLTMNTSIQRNLSDETGTLSRLMVIVLLMGALFAPLVRAADTNESFQYNALFNPTSAQLRVEERGRVMIYDGLDNAVVERALDEQFDRIENMMFIRTRHSSSNDDDEDTADDDGC